MISHLTRAFLLFLLAAFPSVVQLASDGFFPPQHLPFEITVQNAIDRTQPIVWIDARPEASFEIAHIPGALNINLSNWDHALSPLFESYHTGSAVIVYCSAGCTSSETIANRIRDLGLEPTLVLEGGFETWQAYQHPL